MTNIEYLPVATNSLLFFFKIYRSILNFKILSRGFLFNESDRATHDRGKICSSWLWYIICITRNAVFVLNQTKNLRWRILRLYGKQFSDNNLSQFQASSIFYEILFDIYKKMQWVKFTWIFNGPYINRNYK